MIDHATAARYLQAMERHTLHPVKLETTVGDLLVLVGALQLALRHPDLPATTTAGVETFLHGAIRGLQRLEPVLAEVARLGQDPAYDVEG